MRTRSIGSQRFTGVRKMSARYFARSLAVALMAATSIAANPAEAVSGLTVKVATIAAGKLVIVGTALTPGTVVKIDGTTLSTITDAQRTFPLRCQLSHSGLPRGPGDIDGQNQHPRQRMRTDGRRAARSLGVEPAIRLNDLVTDGGSTYRALRTNVNRRPATNVADWQLFASREPRELPGRKVRLVQQAARRAGRCWPSAGPQGPRGATGPAGSQGPAGAAGISPRGYWALTSVYSANDLVIYNGSTYRAARTNVAMAPATHAADWVMFASVVKQARTAPQARQDRSVRKVRLVRRALSVRRATRAIPVTQVRRSSWANRTNRTGWSAGSGWSNWAARSAG